MDLDSLFAQALAAHRAGRLEDAERGYLAVLAARPGYTKVCYPLGLLRAQQGRREEALELIGAALLVTPHEPEMLFHFGQMLMSAGRFAEALAVFNRALDFQPANAAILANRAVIEMRLEQFETALQTYDLALAIEPDSIVLLKGRAEALQRLNRNQEALAPLDRFLALDPDDAAAHNNRGQMLKELGRLDEAMAALDRAIALKPDFARAFYNRGKTLWDRGEIARGFADLMQSARLAGGQASWSAEPQPHKARHDSEQQAYLCGLGRVGALGPVHIEGGERLSSPAVNPANRTKVECQWLQNRPQIVVIDDLLTQEALEALRRYCWGSTVWRTPYKDGYLGAFPEHGFAAPLLAQIAEEFRTVFSGICGDHPLKYIWGFKYDSSLAGIGIHADAAAVNVNFWITPDEANLDPEHGGLVVWDKAAPLDWDFERFNGDMVATRGFLAQSGASAVSVPYRANRAVVFDSDLFHETDVIRFRDGYLDRRINITLLYGNRA